MKQNWTEQELVEFWTLTDSEKQLLEQRTESGRLGYYPCAEIRIHGIARDLVRVRGLLYDVMRVSEAEAKACGS